jgi:hypothetical protein
MSKKHLQRYVDEFAFRLNRSEIDMNRVFVDVVRGATDGQPLPFKELTA